MTDISAKQEQALEGHKAQALADYAGQMLADLCKEYERRALVLLVTKPWQWRKAANLAVSAKAAQEFAQYIAATIANGHAAEAEIAHFKKLEAMSPERRKILGIGLPA